MKTLGPIAATGEAWSRLGPMGPLLDPKVYPARVGQSPESETMRFNQPNVFLKKVTNNLFALRKNSQLYCFFVVAREVPFHL